RDGHLRRHRQARSSTDPPRRRHRRGPARRPLVSADHHLLLAATQKITPPSIEYSSLSPLLIVFVVALLGVLVDAFAPRPARRVIQPVLAGGGFVAALV